MIIIQVKTHKLYIIKKRSNKKVSFVEFIFYSAKKASTISLKPKTSTLAPESKHGTSHTSVRVLEIVVTNCSPDTGNFDLQTTFVARLTPDKSNICSSKFHCYILVSREKSFEYNMFILYNAKTLAGKYFVVLLWRRLHVDLVWDHNIKYCFASLRHQLRILSCPVRIDVTSREKH